MGKNKKNLSIRRTFITYRVYGEGQIMWHDQALYLTKDEVNDYMENIIAISKKNEKLLKEFK